VADARAFIASRPVPGAPRVPGIAVAVLRRAIPSLSVELAELAMARFCAPDRIGPRPFALDLLRSLWRLAGALALMVFRSGGKAVVASPADVLLYCGDQSYYEARFRRIHEGLSGRTVALAGIDRPLLAMTFRWAETWRALASSLWGLPLLLTVSIATGTNLIKGFTRGIVTYGQARRYFAENPARAFLTYEENNSTATVYAAFHDAGGRTYAAFQNGIWYNDEGFDHLRFDHLFSIGQAWIDRHTSLGSRFGEATAIGSLAIGSHRADATLVAPEIDVLVIDQGVPDLGAQHWGAAGASGVSRFLEFVRRFASDHPELRVAYQKRLYSGPARSAEASLDRLLRDAPIEFLDGDGRSAAYRAVARARAVVTMNSTVGLEALAMGRPAVFCNFTGSPDYDVVPGPLQVSRPDYSLFCSRIDAALRGSVGAANIDLDYFISARTAEAPRLIAEALSRSL